MVHIFLINQYAGNQTFEDKLLSRLETLTNLEYYVFNTRRAGDESAVVKQALHMFEGEKLRFYCCGGSGTFRNTLNGFENLEDVEIAFVPCGMTNDFLKVFGEQEKLFEDPLNLVNGKVIKVDYIKTGKGVALNTLSWGWDSNFVKGMEEMRIFRVFGSMVPYFLSLVYAGIYSKPRRMEITLEDRKLEGKFTQIIFGNGKTLGGVVHFAENEKFMDGKASYCVVKAIRGIPMLCVLRKLISHRLNDLKDKAYVGTSKHIHIRSLDNTPFIMNFDGELEGPEVEWDIEIVQKGLNLVVPKEVQGVE